MRLEIRNRGCQKVRSCESQRPTGEANVERWGTSHASLQEQEDHQGDGITHQVSLGGDTDKDEVIPNTNLLSFRPLLGGRVHRPPTGLSYEWVDCQDNGFPQCSSPWYSQLTLESINPQLHHQLPTSSPVWNVSIRMSKPSVPRPLFLAPGQTYAHL